MILNWAKRRQLIDSVWRIYGQKNPVYGAMLKRQWTEVNTNITQFETSIQNSNTNLLRLSDSILSIPQPIARVDSPRYQTFLNAMQADSILLSRNQDLLITSIDKRLKLTQELSVLNDTTKTAIEISDKIKENLKKTGIERQLATDGVMSVRLVWLSGGINYRRDNYSTYDESLQFEKRIDKMPFDKWTFTGAINLLYQPTKYGMPYLRPMLRPSYYVGLNYSLVRTNNYEKIDEQNLNVIQTTTQGNTIYEFSTSKKTRNITGKSFSRSWLHKPAIVITALLGKKQLWGLNLSATFQFENQQKPIFNSRAGLLFRFKDSEKETSLVNFEFFFAFNDLGDIKNEGKSVWQRKQIGISTTVPFKKVFFR